MRNSRFRLRLLFVALLTVLAAAPSIVVAQTPAVTEATKPASLAEQAHAELETKREALEALRQKVNASETDDETLAQLKAQTDDFIHDIAKTNEGLHARLDQIKTRLTELGDPPAEGQPPESSIVADERQRLTAERAEIIAVGGEADTLTTSARDLANEITALRRSLFTDTLFRQTDVSGALFQTANTAFSEELTALSNTFQGWLTFTWKTKKLPFLSAVALSIAAALLFLTGGYRLLGRFIQRDPTREDVPYTSRLSAAFFQTVMQSLAVVAFFVSTYFFLNIFNVLRSDIAPILGAGMGLIGLVYFVSVLSGAAFAANMPNWRLAPLSNGGAWSLSIAVLLMTTINGLDYFFSVVSAELSSPVVLTVARSFLASVLIGLILIVMSFLRPRVAENGDPAAVGRVWPFWGRVFLRVSGIVLIGAALTGYIGLARFIATQLVLTGAVVATMYIGILAGQAVSNRDSFAQTAAGRYLAEHHQLGAVALDQLGLVAGIGIYFLAILIGVPMILLSWGFHPQDLEQWAYKLATEITVGNITISLVAIFGGVLLFVVGLLLTRWVQRWIDGNIMERSHVEAGLRNSVRTGIGYLGVGLAGLIGISAAGFNLSSLALVAGALSLGVGFGLQNIVSNFVSGLILLAERPFKVGDWVVSGTAEGFVKRINVRATEIETFQRQTIIVPNSELINGRVGNWTHRNMLGRAEIAIGVDYSADPRQVMELLLEIGKAHPKVLRNPEPIVLFQNFGESSLDFELRVFLGDVLSGATVKNELRLAIFERFRTDGIGIPFPHRDVTVHLEGEPSAAPKDETSTEKTADDKTSDDKDDTSARA
ncbi:mechanosensitive ion channel family protein [Rhizobiaceae bacterium BDR2-2]|uniref:Mechanosensitive ion channel family protein n=1 Tax=Ectorhizobium quercum TaxID=2965071 RepID=A0AAE3N2E2_9HYPH|nr:mechanosensitive ion channel family protein [Ectorhizobium quercum]MCX8999768.1 mechanosensitive ion channel family protein [Ectorhizobium quercum]